MNRSNAGVSLVYFSVYTTHLIFFLFPFCFHIATTLILNNALSALFSIHNSPPCWEPRFSGNVGFSLVSWEKNIRIFARIAQSVCPGQRIVLVSRFVGTGLLIKRVSRNGAVLGATDFNPLPRHTYPNPVIPKLWTVAFESFMSKPLSWCEKCVTAK